LEVLINPTIEFDKMHAWWRENELASRNWWVLLAMLGVGLHTDVRAIASQLATVGGEACGVNLYSTLERLGRKGYIAASLNGDKSPMRSARTRKHFRVTSKGIREVKEVRRVLTRLWRDLPILEGASSESSEDRRKAKR
jgi:DNA-binding PadR family transcriptional regulator